jgi:hypothetical protein
VARSDEFYVLQSFIMQYSLSEYQLDHPERAPP